MVSAALTTSLRDTLRAGLSVVSESWNYRAKDWVMNVHAVDINHDGDPEIIACSRDGRVRSLNKDGSCRWERIIGSKAWVGAIAGIPFPRIEDVSPIEQGITDDKRLLPVCVIAGTRDGKVYALDQDGRTIGKDGKVFAFDKEGRALEGDEEVAAYWLDTGSVIRQIFVNPALSSDVIIGSQDGSAYALNYETGELHWKFAADGWVRAVFCGDINGDRKAEVIIGSNEKTLYVLTDEGHFFAKVNMQYPIHATYAADVDDDGETEILVATDGKDLVALTPEFQEKWHHSFDNRILSLHVADIDNDGHSEIIAGSEDKHFYILNSQGKRLWRYHLGYRVFSVYATDLNNDGLIEVLVGSEDARIHAYQVQLVKDLEKRILKHYRALGSAAPEVEVSLPADELTLLQDMLGEEVKQHTALTHMNIEEVEQLIAAKQYKEALSQLHSLDLHKVQLLWHKGKKDKLGIIRSLCFGHMGDGRRTIVVGTNDGEIRVYNDKGRLIGLVSIGQRVLDVQTGFLERDRPEDIVVCTSDHQVYIISGMTRQDKRHWPLGYETACIYVTGGTRQRPSEILIGSENKINIYSGDLQAPTSTIPLSEDIRLVYAHVKTEEDMPEIIAGSANRSIHAFTRKGTFLWNYEVWDRVQAVILKDIDGDGEVEVIAGSEDRNVHVLDSKGHLRWRYFLPHSVLALQAVDIDQDDKVEILAGCADGNLHILNRDGDLLWKYHANDRIRAIKVADIDNDGNIEIVVGSEDELEVLQVVNQQHVRDLIDGCLSALQEKSTSDEVNSQLLYSPDPMLKAFAIIRMAKQANPSQDVLNTLGQYVKDGFVEVRKALLQAAITRYALNPQWAFPLLNHLSIDADQEVRLAFVEHMSALMRSDWKQGIVYLDRFFTNSDRMIRRAVVRQLDRLIDISQDRDKDKDIFDLLFKASQYEDSEWIRQEAARTLAHLLDHHNGRLIFYMHLFIVRELRPGILEMIGRYAKVPLVQKYVLAIVPLITDLQDANVLDRLKTVIDALKDMTSLEFGRDSLKMYEEYCRLFSISTIDGIAYYRCQLNENDIGHDNKRAAIVLSVLKRLSPIARSLNIYMRREGANDRLSSLLDTLKAVDEVWAFVEHEYSGFLMKLPITQLPDHRLFELLLRRWQTIVLTQLNELRGKANLSVELQTKNARNEEQVGIWIKVSNTGRGSADNVKVTLLHNDDFDVVGSRSSETETLLSQESWQVEFTIKPHSSCLDLRFEVIYDDAEKPLKNQRFTDRLELQSVSMPQEFRYIPNPYSTGTPIHDSHMFYGRDDDVAALRNNLTRAAAQTVLLLYGQRRSGKTTLLLHLVNSPVLEEHIPILIDMQRESYNISASRFLHNVAFYIARAMVTRGYPIQQPEPSDFATDPTFAFGVFLDDVETRLHGQKLIILIDEFEVLEDQIKKGKLEPELLGYLRSMMQHHHSINFLLSGTHQIDQLTQGDQSMRENWSVFFNIARQYRLSRLSSQGAEDLIKKPVENYLEYGSYTVEKIRQLTADHPYFIHLLCRSLIDHCNGQRKTYVTLNDVNMVLHEVMQTCDSHFDWLWKQLSPQEQIALAIIAEHGKEEGRLLPYAEIEEIYRRYHLPYDRERMQVNLKALGEADIIETVSDNVLENTFFGMRFRVPVGLMRMWLHREKPLRLIVGEQQVTVL